MLIELLSTRTPSALNLFVLVNLHFFPSDHLLRYTLGREFFPHIRSRSSGPPMWVFDPFSESRTPILICFGSMSNCVESLFLALMPTVGSASSFFLGRRMMLYWARFTLRSEFGDREMSHGSTSALRIRMTNAGRGTHHVSEFTTREFRLYFT